MTNNTQPPRQWHGSAGLEPLTLDPEIPHAVIAGYATWAFMRVALAAVALAVVFVVVV